LKIALRIAGLGILAGMAFWLWTMVFPSPEKAVMKRVSALAATATMGANDGAIVRASKVSSLIGFFSTDAEINYDIPGVGAGSLSGRDEIRESLVGGFSRATALNVQFVDVVVRVGADRQSAEASCTARVNTGDSKDFVIQELRFQFKQVARDWLIARVETVKTLH
jgi:hypothetical protein